MRVRKSKININLSLNKKTLTLGFIWLLIGIIPCLAQQQSPSIKQKIETFVQNYYDKGAFQGQVLVAQHGSIIYHNAFGFSDLDHKKKNNLNTNFLIASTTKSFTATLAMKFVQNGNLDLHLPVTNYIPELRDELGNKLTVHLLLKMQSGLPGHLRELVELKYTDLTKEEFIKIINTAKLLYEPGSGYNYSNNNYALVAYILETISGLSFPELMQNYIFSPLKMNNSGIERTNDKIKNRALGYDKNDNGSLILSEPCHIGYAIGSGDIYSTAIDLLKFDQALYDDGFISAEYREVLFDGHPSKEYDNYAYGFKVREYARSNVSAKKGKLVRHGGSFYGYLANMHRYIDDNLTIIVLGNMRPYPIMEITFGLKEIALGRAPKPRKELVYKY